VDALHVAARHFQRGERVDMGRLADELGIDRVTLYRWVGSRERFMAEVCWYAAKRALDVEVEAATGTGPERVARIIAGYARRLEGSDAIQRFLAEEREFAFRLLTRSDGGVQPRVVAAIGEILQQEADRGNLDVPIDLSELAYALVRLGETYVYSRVLTGERADLTNVEALIKLVLR
jgi:AcrR family transcriptional regulator